MAKVELKKPIVEEISANIADAQGIVLVNYIRLRKQNLRRRCTIRGKSRTQTAYRTGNF